MYISVTELGIPEETLIRLTDDEGAGSVNNDRASAAIAAAQALVDAAISRMADVPLSEPTGLVRKLTEDMAVYFLYLRVGSLTDEVKAGYENALDILDRVADGRLCILQGGGGQANEFISQDREFSREYLEGM